MKKVTELMNELKSENINDTLGDIIGNDDITLNSLTEKEKFAVLLFRELKKAFDNDKLELVLDCNYKQSKLSTSKVDYYRVIDKLTKASYAQIYPRLIVASSRADFRLYTSSNMHKNQLKKLLDVLREYTQRPVDVLLCM